MRSCKDSSYHTVKGGHACFCLDVVSNDSLLTENLLKRHIKKLEEAMEGQASLLEIADRDIECKNLNLWS